jgi:hypothetical protein
MNEQERAELSRQYDADGSVRPSRDTGYRFGMPWKEFVPSNQ